MRYAIHEPSYVTARSRLRRQAAAKARPQSCNRPTSQDIQLQAVKALEAQNLQQHEEISRLSTRIAEMQGRLEDLQQREGISKLRTQIAEMQGRLEDLRTGNASFEKISVVNGDKRIIIGTLCPSIDDQGSDGTHGVFSKEELLIFPKTREL